MSYTQIQQATAAYFGITLDELCMGGTRRPNVVTARHVARFLERETQAKSLAEIAVEYNCGDHTTVLASVRHMTDRLAANDPRYVDAVAAISSVVKMAHEEKKAARGAAAHALEAMSCPTCGAPVIRELQRQIALLHARVIELGGGR